MVGTLLCAISLSPVSVPSRTSAFRFPCSLLRIGCTVLLLITSPVFILLRIILRSLPDAPVFHVQKPVIPYKENVDSPDLPTVICLFICMFACLCSSSIFTRSSVSKNFCRIRKKTFLLPIVIRIFFEPYPDRNRISFFFSAVLLRITFSAAPRSATLSSVLSLYNATAVSGQAPVLFIQNGTRTSRELAIPILSPSSEYRNCQPEMHIRYCILVTESLSFTRSYSGAVTF